MRIFTFTFPAILIAAGSVAIAQPIVVQPGDDRYTTGGAEIRFGVGSELPGIPSGFFYPGSQPFEGVVVLAGNPLAPLLDNADTVISRLAPFPLPPLEPTDPPIVAPFTPFNAPVPIQLIALRLQSVQPIAIPPQPNSLWHVVIEIDMTTPPTQGQGIFTTSKPYGGRMDYQGPFQPRIRFVPVGGGPPRDFAVPPFPVQSAPPACASAPHITHDFSRPCNPAFGPCVAGMTLGPSPVISADPENNGECAWIELRSPTGGFVQRLHTARSTDCDLNGIADAVEIASGAARDDNRNGVPDSCEVFAGLVQFSFPDYSGGWVERFSEVGEVGVSYIATDGFLWGHVRLNGQVVVQNYPLIDINLPGTRHTTWIPFDLGTPGLQVGTADVAVFVTEDQLETLPTMPIHTCPVPERLWTAGMRGGDDENTIVLPPLVDNPVRPGGDQVSWERKQRRNVPGVSEAEDHCAPGAAARSLAWLAKAFCIMLPANKDEAQEIYDKLRNEMHMSTQPRTPGEPGGTTDDGLRVGCERFVNGKGLAECLTVKHETEEDRLEIKWALDRGADVLGLLSSPGLFGQPPKGHVITITGYAQCGTDTLIYYRDDSHGADRQQDGKPDSEEKSCALTGPTTGPLTPVGVASSLDAYVVIDATRLKKSLAALKWLIGALGGGGAEGVRPRAQRAIAGEPLSSTEKKELREWATTAHDVAEYLSSHTQTYSPSSYFDTARSLAAEMAERARLVRVAVESYFASGVAADLSPVPALVAEFETIEALIEPYLDCDGNEVGDEADIALGDLADIDLDGVPDICRCPADYDGNGTREVTDIFAFLTDWFAGSPAAYNFGGTPGVPAIFAFLTAWFAGCP